MKKHLPNLILIGVFLLGLSLLLYPTVSNWWNSFHQSRAVSTYTEIVATVNNEDYDELWDKAIEHNQTLAIKGNNWRLTEEEQHEYERLLKLEHTDVMGYIEIPKIKCMLPIYHGTDEAVLQAGVGHIEGTSLPTGGLNTHCVISGHRGLPSAKLFSNLDQLKEGDSFKLKVLDEVLNYEVDQIRIVLPDEIQDLKIVEGEDYCTLVTCTPYGVNSHRLLVRGKRVEGEEVTIRVSADAVQIEPILVAPAVAVPILFVLLNNCYIQPI